ncbi:MAG: hypothetical protein AAF648_10365 [Pseudomonadota bacterium]
MAYLLSQYTILFLVTALLAFLLGRWWARRHYVDVTESWESLRTSREQEEGFRDRLWTGLEELRRSVAPTVRNELAALPQPEVKDVDLSSVLAELRRVHERIDALPQPQPVAFDPVLSRLAVLEQRIEALPAPQAINFDPIAKRMSELEQAIMAIPLPKNIDLAPLQREVKTVRGLLEALPAPQRLDLSPVVDQVADLDASIKALPQPAAADFTGVETRLDRVEERLGNHRASDVDLSPLNERLAKLERLLEELPRFDRQDLQSVNFRLGELERSLRSPLASEAELKRVSRQMAELEQGLAVLRPAADPAGVAARRSESVPAPQLFDSPPQLFDSPERGEPDDLKRISGVGPKLEQLLHRNGVYYFWQVASWSPADVQFIDDRLEVFRGRIARDEWVKQAQAFVAEADGDA